MGSQKKWRSALFRHIPVSRSVRSIWETRVDSQSFPLSPGSHVLTHKLVTLCYTKTRITSFHAQTRRTFHSCHTRMTPYFFLHKDHYWAPEAPGVASLFHGSPDVQSDQPIACYPCRSFLGQVREPPSHNLTSILWTLARGRVSDSPGILLPCFGAFGAWRMLQGYGPRWLRVFRGTFCVYQGTSAKASWA